jgi:hypothetical protein
VQQLRDFYLQYGNQQESLQGTPRSLAFFISPPGVEGQRGRPTPLNDPKSAIGLFIFIRNFKQIAVLWLK